MTTKRNDDTLRLQKYPSVGASGGAEKSRVEFESVEKKWRKDSANVTEIYFL